MNNIKLIIKKLGPIVNTEINMAPVMIFTGSSNLGKSYVNFLAYYVMNVFSSNRITGFLHTKISDETAAKKEFSFKFSLDDLCRWMEQDVKLFFQYLLNYPDVPCEVSFEFESKITDFNLTVKRIGNFKGISKDSLPVILIQIKDQEIMYLLTSNDIINDISVPVSRALSDIISGIEKRNSYLLPPGRASLLNESYSRQAESSKIGMYDIFLRDFDRINNLRNNNMQKSGSRKIDKKTINLINGALNSTKDGLFLKLQDDINIPLSAAASSIKELSPFLLWMETEDFYKDSMCIEEPEAHAHPEMQYGIADMIATCINKGAFIQMTTHSDYMLARLNQLIKLYDLKNTDVALFEKISKGMKIDKELALDKSKINAYYFFIDKDSHKIRVQKQDVSDGVPFTTFMDAVKMQMDWDNLYEGDADYGNI